MATLTRQVPVAAGTVLSFAAAAPGGDQYINSGKEMLVVDNASGAPITVTFAATRECERGVLHDIAQSVAAGAREMFPPVPPAYFNNADTGRVSVTYSATASVTVAVVSAS
jgi:hypothetical protein